MSYLRAGRIPVMATSKKNPRPKNAVFIAMMKRHGSTVTVMKDRRQPRGGSKNKAREFLSGNY